MYNKNIISFKVVQLTLEGYGENVITTREALTNLAFAGVLNENARMSLLRRALEPVKYRKG